MAGRLEERLQRGIERLTLFRAVRMVATVALSLALVAAVLETIVDSGINGFRDALWWAIVTVTTVRLRRRRPDDDPAVGIVAGAS